LGSGYAGDAIPRDGIATLPGYAATVYQAVNFYPVCGTLDPFFTFPYDMWQYCVPVMSVYNSTSELSAFYDQTGIRMSVSPASGVPGCMCFSLSMSSGKSGDICLAF